MTARGTKVLFTAAPLLMFAGSFVHPDEPSDAGTLRAVLADHQIEWLTAHLLLLAGVTALVPVVLGLVAAARAVAPRLAAAAAVGGVAGCGAAAAIFGGSIVGAYAGQGDPAAMTAFLDRVMQSAPYNGLFLVVLAMFISVVVLLAVLARTGRISTIAAVLAGLGFVVAVLPEPVPCIGWALSAAGLSMVARQLGSLDREAAQLTRQSVAV